MAVKGLDEIEVPEILPPSEDGVFKTLLTHRGANICLRDIVSSNIGLPVAEATVRNTEFPISDVSEKRERFDVCCEIDGGGQVDVEMQANPMAGDNLRDGHKNIISRAIFYVCDLHVNQIGAGIKYGDLARTYQITFCGYTVFEGRENCFNRFSFRNADGEELLDAVNVIIVELSKLERVMLKSAAEMTGAEAWAVFLAHANKPESRTLIYDIIAEREEIRMAYDILTNISQDAEERARFRARRKFQMDLQHDKIVSREEGKLEGELEGKLAIARNMLTDDLPVDRIVRYTGLAPEQIESLRVGG